MRRPSERAADDTENMVKSDSVEDDLPPDEHVESELGEIKETVPGFHQ